MPTTKFSVEEKYSYLEGFGGYHQSEVVRGANPVGINSPQVPGFGLCTERISGTSFTAPRATNLQTWMYRVHPSLSQGKFSAISTTDNPPKFQLSPNPLQWNDFPMEPGHDWISSQKTLARSGDPATKAGLAYLVYSASKDMDPQTVFFSADGDYLIIPHAGTLDIQTELGSLLVRQNEIAVIPRGIRYRVTVPNGPARGYICELFQGHFQLPELGPIGSCSLANVRDFQIPTAHFEGSIENGIATCQPSNWSVIIKLAGKLYSRTQDHTPFDVVAWHGTYYPYKYDLGRFSVIGSTLFDHPDPSISTVLTAPSHREPGTAVVDFAIFPPRWYVMEDTYWPPYFHRNTMSEFIGVVVNSQDEGKGEGFKPLGALLNNPMVPHGVDEKAHEEARVKVLGPEKVGMEGYMFFLLEAEAMMAVSDWGMDAAAGADVKAKL
ncbi:homogentisate 1,2-dioxygenase [Mollisia scopiformis]|uniref:homogentisate 1,2-dioxygenase n=1 Tax=Mollisia scopiformis TaxID=149040 RepID=A0A194WSY7_MOLSC|nr:homogentisate 1,2-dioxygenase [Mollisia scopiformis]KUJ11068.1 homogentisate 1,2-dioxygenase [Mollisia scopiformis]